MSTKGNVTITMTREEALAADLLVCKCGHRPNNHFQFSQRPCAHCECESYREIGRYGKLINRA